MTTSDLRAWLRRELQSDREAIRAKSATDWLLTLVETTLPLYLWARCFFASTVWAINHQGEIQGDSPEPELNLRLRGPAMEHPQWSTIDALQVAGLCLWLPVWFHAALWGGGPLWAELIVGLQGLALVVEPARVGVRGVIHQSAD